MALLNGDVSPLNPDLFFFLERRSIGFKILRNGSSGVAPHFLEMMLLSELQAECLSRW